MLAQLVDDVKQLKEYQKNVEYVYQQSVNTELKQRQRYEVQPHDLLGMHTAVVVSTIDPLKQGRVRWYNPYLVEGPQVIEACPWASPISPFGGFDDSGAIWVPPAGSTIVIFFHSGHRDSAYYMGTIWTRKRGPNGRHLEYWNNQPIPEYDCLYEGRRDGYNIGGNDGSQVFPPWNTEMYNSYDNDSITEFYQNPQQLNSSTYAHIYGFKTVEKSGLKISEGDPRCNRRWKRMEIFTGGGNFIVMKDDHLHPAGQWAYGADMSLAYCHREDNPDLPKEFACCEGTKSTIGPCSQDGCVPVKNAPCEVSKGKSSSTIERRKVFANPFYKRQDEQRFYEGAPTPQANRCDLPQSGIHVQSLSGHQMAFDDSVNQPQGVPGWRRKFDFGCDNTFLGKMHFRSATGHYLGLHDMETVGMPGMRNDINGIYGKTATGNILQISDHTVKAGAGCACPGNFAGDMRGFTLRSTSTHMLQLNDKGLVQCSPPRRDGGIPKIHDKPGFGGYCLLRSGYGLQLLMKDEDRQDRTVQQFIELLAPQKDNFVRGPHVMVMQEQPRGPGLVMLRAGGIMFTASYDDSMEVVGVDENPSNKYVSVTGSQIVDTKELYYNHSKNCYFFSENYIYMLAGRDCPPAPDGDEDLGDLIIEKTNQELQSAVGSPGTLAGKSQARGSFAGECGPCAYPVVVAKDPWVCPAYGFVHYGVLPGENEEDPPLLDSRSLRVFASATNPTGTKGCQSGVPEV